jgi:hypothetical protein
MMVLLVAYDPPTEVISFLRTNKETEQGFFLSRSIREKIPGESLLYYLVYCTVGIIRAVLVSWALRVSIRQTAFCIFEL